MFRKDAVISGICNLNYYNLQITEYLKPHDYVNGFIFIDDFQDADIFDMMTNINMVQLQQYMSILIVSTIIN